MILAAGRGKRMRPLSDTTPKPLLQVAGKPLIVYHLEALAKAGVREIVINHAHLGDQIVAALGDGQRWGVTLHYSPEPPAALETGGAIRQALHWLGSGPFLVLNGDLWLDGLDFARLTCPAERLAHLLLVPNPEHHPEGDFTLHQGAVSNQGTGTRLTFSGVGLYRAELFAATAPGSFPLAPLLRQAATAGAVSGERLSGEWADIGTPQRLAALDRRLRERLRER